MLFCSAAGRVVLLRWATCRLAWRHMQKCRRQGPGRLRSPAILVSQTAPPPACPCLQRLLELLRPERVHILERGRVARSGGMELVERLEAGGYAALVA